MDPATVTTREHCEALDRGDPLCGWRERFRLPEGVVYLDGNSLGALPATVPQRLAAVVETEWGEGLIRSWNTAGWYQAPRRLGDKVARLVGAAAGEVVVGDSTSVNLHKLLAAALALRPGRRAVVMREDDFPTDLYIAEGLGALGVELRAVPAGELAGALDEDCAVLAVSHVHYVSGELLDMSGLTRAVHAAGALALWDCSHSAGALPLDLDGCAVDLATGCGYKFLNGGPGAPAWLFVAARHQEAAHQPLTGWFGHARPFAFEPAYARAPGIAHFLSGTPAILGMAALEAALDLWLEVGGLEAVRAKSIGLGDLLIALVERRCADRGLTVASPRRGETRGSQVALRHPHAYPVMQALIARGVVGDVREPSILRFGLTPLYLRFTDVWDAVEALREVLDSEAWRRPEHARRAAVT